MLVKRPRIIPVLLIDNQRLVKTIRFDKSIYLGDPINAVRIFNEKEVDELCLLDITASRENREPDFDFLEEIASEAFMPMSYGGGITNIEHIKRIFKIGFEKVVLNSIAYSKPELVKEASNIAGSQSIVVSIDAKKNIFGKYETYILDGKKNTKSSPVKIAREAENNGAGEIIINSIDNDGMMQGYDKRLIKSIVDCVSVPVIACGGAGGISDLKDIIYECNAHAAAAGSMFVFYGKKRAVLINFPTEHDLIIGGVYK